MSTCSILIKIKDYFPKIDSIPYQNFICLFTNGENEGQIPLISKEDETFQHQIKNVLNDIKYKIHVLDYNDMSLIGMCEMVISYNIISQITPPNGFVQEQQKKLLMDTNTKRKLFGTVLNMGDIYLDIYSEIYLCETKNNNNINTKITSNRKKNKIWGTEGGSKKKLDGSPRTVRKKQIMMQINSDRRALVNINNKNGNNNLDKKQKYQNINSSGKNDKNMTCITNPIINTNNVKPNSSFNYRDIIPSKESKNNNNNFDINKNNIYKKINNNIKNKNELKNKPKHNPIKNIIDRNNFINSNNEKDKENNLFNYNIYNRYKTETNKNGLNSNLTSLTKKLENIDYKKQKSKPNIKHSLISSGSPKQSNDNLKEAEEIPFNNNTGNKITTIESLENINFSGKKYITKTNQKKNNSQSNITGLGNNTLFSTTSTEQEFNDMDKIILEKGTEIRNDFNSQLKNTKKISLNYNINNINLNNTNNTNNKIISNIDNENIIKMQTEIKNNFIKLIEFYSLLSHKMVKIRAKNISAYDKNVIYKEKLFTELKKNNALTQKKTILEAENFMNINNHGSLNEKFLRPMIKMKKLEFKIFQNIFNLFYYEYDILKFKEYENNKKMDENVKIELLLMVFKNLAKNYGNISQIYLSNNTKKALLKNCFNKYGIEEKKNGGWDMNAYLREVPQNEKNEKNKIIEKKENKNDIDKFKVIKEVDEEKEEEFDEEEKMNSVNSGRISNNQISNSNSNTKENANLCSNEKVKSSNKSDKNISEQKKLFENNDDSSANKKEKKLEEVKYNLSEKIIETDNEQNLNNKDIKPYSKNDLEKEEHNNNDTEIQEKNINEEEKIINDNNKIDNEIKNKEEKIEQVTPNENAHIKDKKINESNNEIIPKLNNEKSDNDNEKNNSQIKNKENNLEINLDINNKEKLDEEKIKPPTKREIYTRKNRHKYMIEPEQESSKENNNNIIKNDKPYYRKNKFKKEIYDEEDLVMQKILTEDFPKKCKDENRFIRISKYEYSFGDEKIKVIYRDGDVVLQLDEGDYKLQEFIDILNEGKNEEENFDNDNENNEDNNIEVNDESDNEHHKHQEKNEKKQDKDINNNKKEILENDKNEINSEKSDKDNNSLSSEQKHKKRRKKRVSEDNSIEKDKIEKEQKSETEKEAKKEKKEIAIEKEINNNNYNSDINDKNKISNTEGNESDINSENKSKRYIIKRRRDYKEKKLK